MSTFSVKSIPADRHFAKLLHFIIIASDTFSDISYVFKIHFFTLFNCSTGIYPDNIAIFMGTKVNLQTWVKVKENWRDSAASLRNFGFIDQ